MTMQEKYKGETTQDHFSELRRNERNKSNMKHQLEKATKVHSPASIATTGTTLSMSGKSGKGNKENMNNDLEEDESDDERSSDEDGEDSSDIEKYLNLDNKMTATQHGGSGGEGSVSTNFSRLLKTRRYATPGMAHGVNYGIINSFFTNDSDRDISNSSNNNISSSSCSTPTTAPPTQQQQHGASSFSYKNKTKTNKRDFTTSYENNKSNPSSSSQPATPKKSNLSGAESDTGEKCINKFSNRTKMFLTSFLKFKRSLRVKRRNSNSCSDLFVI